METGDHVLELDAPGHACVEGVRWPRGLNEVDVPVEPNTITTMYLICPAQWTAEPSEVCFNPLNRRYAVCGANAPGCMVQEAGASPVCVEDVGPCADETPTCVGDILVRACRNLQPHGIDCFELGGRCDAEAGRRAIRPRDSAGECQRGVTNAVAASRRVPPERASTPPRALQTGRSTTI